MSKWAGSWSDLYPEIELVLTVIVPEHFRLYPELDT
jgi:hypothetical protein